MATPTERPLTDDEQGEIEEELATARAVIPGAEGKDADGVVLAIRDLVDEVRDDKRAAPRSLDETGFLAGVLLGDALTSVARFEWVHLEYDSGFSSIGLVSWDRSFVCFPFHYVFELMADDDKENTIGTLWEMVKGEQGPGVTAGAYLPLG